MGAEMTIELNARYGYELIIEAENVRLVEDIESREYPKDQNGKIIYNGSPNRDVSTDAIRQFTSVLENMIYYRKADFDSSELIKLLFEKLPDDVAIDLAKWATNEYTEDQS
jgi:hypothetical protein